MANSAGSDPRSTRSVHHATANARSACGSTPANVHSLRARSRSITSLALRHLYLGRVLGCHTVYRRVARCEAALPRPLFRNLIDSLPTRSRRLPHGRQAAFPEATTGGSPPRAARPRARAAARRARPPRVQGRDRRLADGAAWGQAGGTTVHSLAPARRVRGLEAEPVVELDEEDVLRWSPEQRAGVGAEIDDAPRERRGAVPGPY